jgi:hypothetical protein
VKSSEHLMAKSETIMLGTNKPMSGKTIRVVAHITALPGKAEEVK